MESTGVTAMFDPDSSWTRRNFVKLIGRAGLISAVPNLAHAAAVLNPDTVCISILHTTDLHGHILPTSDYDGNPDSGRQDGCVTNLACHSQHCAKCALHEFSD